MGSKENFEKLDEGSTSFTITRKDSKLKKSRPNLAQGTYSYFLVCYRAGLGMLWI